MAWHWSREEEKILLSCFPLLQMLSGTEHVLITILKKTRSEKLLKPVFFLYSPESCVPTTAEHTKGPLEQNFLSSVTRGNPTGIFVKFEINLERWVRYISRGAISPSGADLLLVNDRLLFLKDWKKQTHFRERNLSSMMASIYFKQALWRKAKAHWYSICKHVLTFSTMVWKKQ